MCYIHLLFRSRDCEMNSNFNLNFSSGKELAAAAAAAVAHKEQYFANSLGRKYTLASGGGFNVAAYHPRVPPRHRHPDAFTSTLLQFKYIPI